MPRCARFASLALACSLTATSGCAPTPPADGGLVVCCPDGGGRDAGPRDASTADPGPGSDAGEAIVDGGVPVDGGALVDGGPLVDGGVPDAGPPLPKHVILFIGDGMGAAQVEAARRFASGGQVPLLFETLPVRGDVSTANASGGVTDSAAAATAMATGHKANNGVISVALPGDGAVLPTALELHAACGHRTGLVTTNTPLTDATPAAFGAHEASRGNQAEIAADYFTSSRPNLLLGPVGSGITPEAAAAAGYEVALDEAGLVALDADQVTHVSAQLTSDTTPRLSELVQFSLDVLEEDPDGFFLFVEHEGTDNGGHGNDLGLIIDSVLELEEAFAVAEAWAEGSDDTLLVLTADHETGGLTLTGESSSAGVLPGHAFSTGGHTGVDVPLYASGPGSELLAGSIDNTRIFDALTVGLCP